MIRAAQSYREQKSKRRLAHLMARPDNLFRHSENDE